MWFLLFGSGKPQFWVELPTKNDVKGMYHEQKKHKT